MKATKNRLQKSLRTHRWPEARRIRDTEFAPLILKMEIAQTQVELAHKLYPEMQKKLQSGLHGGYGNEEIQAFFKTK